MTTSRHDSAEGYAEAHGYSTAEEYLQARATYDTTGTGHHPGLCSDRCPTCRKSPSTPHTGATMAAHADRMTRTGNSGMCPAPPTRRGGPQLDRDTEWEYEQERADYDD